MVLIVLSVMGGFLQMVKDRSRGMLGDLVDRVFEGSAMAAVVNLLETSDIDETELEQLRDLIGRKVKE